MEDFLRDSPIDTGPKGNYGDNRNNRDMGLNFQDLQYNQNANLDPVFDFNVQDTTRESNIPAVNDPYYETFDFLGSPNNNNVSPVGAIDPSGGLDLNRSESASVEPFSFGVAGDPLNTLDLIISPPSESDNNNIFGSSQYFSPTSRSAQFSHLNPIAENTYSGSYHDNSYTPEAQQGGISIPASLNLGLYLSPNAYVSPSLNMFEGSYDTIASPYSSSLINSPPPMNLTQSASIPNATNFALASLSRALSPPPTLQHGLGVSAPSGPTVSQQRKMNEPVVAGQNLTQEEKAKRRREFHNAVERRRRDLIKEKIKVLGVLVPPSLLTPQICATQALLKLNQPLSAELSEFMEATKVKEVKPNKASILLTSVDYIRHLQYVLERQKERKEEIEAAIASYENGPGSFSYTEIENFTPNTSLHNQPVADFNPDEFFSDVIRDTK